MKTILCLLVMMLGLTMTMSAQEKVFQKADFDVLLKNAVEILKAKPHRIVVVSLSDVNGKPQEAESSKTIVEVASEDKRRSVREYKSADKNLKREFVRVGAQTYLRENEGKWTQTVASANQSPTNMKVVDEQIQYKLIGKETLGGKNSTVYQRTKNSRMTDNSTNEEIQSTEVVKYWFDENGNLLKRERNRENRRGGKIFHFTNTATFEYDSSIQVAAPGV